MKINIRKAKKEDCVRLMELITELAVYEKSPSEVTVTFDHFVESGFGENPIWWAYVAEADDEKGLKLIAGFALYYIRYSTWKGQRMYLEDIIVTEKMRGNGIGKMLFESLIKVCKEENLKGIAWQVLDWNEPALNFYKKFKEVKLDPSWINGSLD